MAIINSHSGSWGVGNFRLPDFGITEKLTSNRTAQGGSNVIGSRNAYAPPKTSTIPNFQTYETPISNPRGDILGAGTTAGGGGTSNQGIPANSFNLDQNIPSPDQGTPDGGPSELDMINSEFNDFQSFLGNQESQANQNFTNTQNAITGERDLAVTDAEKQRGFREQELDAKALQGRESERLSLRKVRQLLQDLEQRNASRLAISGGGSTADALAERFGRTAQEQTGNVLSEGQRYQNDLSLEGEKVDQFYDNSISKIKPEQLNRMSLCQE